MLIPFGVFSAAGAGGGAAAGAYELISTAYGTGSSGTITFSSIPSTYKHLQIRAVYKPTTGNAALIARFNGDATSTYSTHYLDGNGTSVSSAFSAGTELAQLGYANGSLTGYDGFSIIDILNYGSSTTYKTVRALRGRTDGVRLVSGSWRNTAAVTSIALLTSADVFATTSRISLYGIKG